MSTYTVAEIVIWLLLAAVLGFALGWTTHALRHRRRRVVKAPVEPAPGPHDSVAQAAAALAASEEQAPTFPERPGPYRHSVLPGPDDAAPGPEWVVKAKISSMICHPPGSPAYDRTRADVWFRNERDALDAGFRTPKSG